MSNFDGMDYMVMFMGFGVGAFFLSIAIVIIKWALFGFGG